MKLLALLILVYSGSLAATQSLVMEFSPLRAAIGESDIRIEAGITDEFTIGLQASQYQRISSIDSNFQNSEQSYEGHVYYYPGLAELQGLFFGPKLGFRKYNYTFSQPLPVRTYSEFQSEPDMKWQSQISRVAAGASIGWRFMLGSYLTTSITADFMSTVSEQLQVVDQDVEYNQSVVDSTTPEHFEKRIMLHLGLAIP